MKPYRFEARNAVRRIIADPVSGFNARMAALATEYDVESLEIDFGRKSRSFLQSAINPDADDFDFSQAFPAPIAMTLYTQAAINTKLQNAGFWSGPVEVRIDVYLQFRNRTREGIDSIELDDTETICDAIEEAILQALHDDAADWGSVVYNLDVRTDRGSLNPVGDGWQQRFSILLACEVHV